MDFGDRPRTCGRRLGVKGSQVQILSARQRETAGQGPCSERSGTAPDCFPRRFDPRYDHHQGTLRSCTFAVLVGSVSLGNKHGAWAVQAAGRVDRRHGLVAAFSGGAGPQAYLAAKAAVLDLGRDPACRHLPGTGRLLPWRSR